MKILAITPEVAPFAKVGGLADVAGALPKALEENGHEVRVVCPLYGCVRKDGAWRAHSKPLVVPMGHEIRYARVWETSLPGSNVAAYFIEYDEFFGRPEIYEGPWGWHGDNDKRYAFFCRAALELALWLRWVPDVVHVHDWATGFVPVMLNTVYRDTALGRTASVITIHNIQHQGYCDRSILDFAGLPDWLFRPEHVEAMGAVSMLKGGVYHSSKITTVSPTYAREIQGPVGGNGMHEILRHRGGDLVGVLNGIDTSVWTPSGDPHLPAPFSASDMTGKDECKRALCGLFGLTYDAGTPIFGVVSRLYDQKGLDLLAEIIPELMDTMKIQIALLGTGDGALERAFCDFNGRYPGRVATWIGFDDARAHLIYGGSDFFVMPSRFEPCGLGQMYAMAYGTVPVVRATGGLVDTVRQYNERDGTGTGFLFDDPNSRALYYAMGWACSTWYDRPAHYAALQERGMLQDFSWEASARAYANVFRWSIEARNGVAEEEAIAE